MKTSHNKGFTASAISKRADHGDADVSSSAITVRPSGDIRERWRIPASCRPFTQYGLSLALDGQVPPGDGRARHRWRRLYSALDTAKHPAGVHEVGWADDELGEETGPARRVSGAGPNEQPALTDRRPFADDERPAEVDRANGLQDMSRRMENENMRRIDLGHGKEHRPVGAVGDAVAHLHTLELVHDLVGASLPDPEREQVEHVRGVPAATMGRESHLSQPRPDRFRRRVDRDAAGGLPHRVGYELVTGQRCARLEVRHTGAVPDSAQPGRPDE